MQNPKDHEFAMGTCASRMGLKTGSKDVSVKLTKTSSANPTDSKGQECLVSTEHLDETPAQDTDQAIVSDSLPQEPASNFSHNICSPEKTESALLDHKSESVSDYTLHGAVKGDSDFGHLVQSTPRASSSDSSGGLPENTGEEATSSRQPHVRSHRPLVPTITVTAPKDPAPEETMSRRVQCKAFLTVPERGHVRRHSQLAGHEAQWKGLQQVSEVYRRSRERRERKKGSSRNRSDRETAKCQPPDMHLAELLSRRKRSEPISSSSSESETAPKLSVSAPARSEDVLSVFTNVPESKSQLLAPSKTFGAVLSATRSLLPKVFYPKTSSSSSAPAKGSCTWSSSQHGQPPPIPRSWELQEVPSRDVSRVVAPPEVTIARDAAPRPRRMSELPDVRSLTANASDTEKWRRHSH